MHHHSNANSGKWKRVSRHHPCPICGKPDWCMYAGPDDFPDAAICARVESDRCVGSEGAGWLHKLRNDHQWHNRPRQRRVAIELEPDRTMPLDFCELVVGWYAALGPNQRECIASDLGVSAKALDLMRVGWSVQYQATTWPMYDGGGNFCGVRLRRSDGSKFAVRGSRNGIFVACGADPFGCDHAIPGTLVIVEGATDAAAMLSIGIECYGRPSCSGGVEAIIEFCAPHIWDQVAIIADNDAPGQRGARYLAARLVGYVRSGVRIVTPPAKDAREWVCNGATHDDVRELIDAAPVMQLTYGVKAVAR